jgi:protein TonB
MGTRAFGMACALLLEALLLLLLLSLGRSVAGTKETVTFVDFKAVDASDPAPQPSDSAEPEPRRANTAEPRPAAAEVAAPPRPADAPAAPAITPAIPIPRAPAPPSNIGVGPRPIQSPPPSGPVAGPANSGSSGDSQRVGTAPNGEPLYAARWYREPYDDELRGYLSTASGPGWGLIACRTVPDFRVEDCVGLGEYPQGSMIMRSALAAAWQFKVRPPRRGGQSLVGAWVRIRIDYQIRREGG